MSKADPISEKRHQSTYQRLSQRDAFLSLVVRISDSAHAVPPLRGAF